MKFNLRKKTVFGHGLRLFVLSLVLSLSLSLICSVVVEAQADYYEKDFEWDYKDRHWTWSLSIPKSLYNKYKSVSVSLRTRNGLAGYGFLTTTDDDYLQIVADKLQKAASEKGYNAYDTVSFALAFVQSLPYTSDSETSGYDEYPRFPLETLVDEGGDCEDTSILFATLTLIMNYSTVYINPPDHVAVGVWGKDLLGSYYTYNDKNYYYCETTGSGFEIGETPTAYRNQKAYIYDIRYYEQYDPKTGNIPFDIDFDSLGVELLLLVVVALFAVIAIGYRSWASARAKKEHGLQSSAQAESIETSVERPGSLGWLAFVLVLGGVINLLMSTRAFNTDLEALNWLSSLHPYLRTAIPIELILSLAGFSLSLLSIYTGYGLWKGEPWSINTAYFVSIGVSSITIIGLILYSSAPSELGIQYTDSIFSLVLNFVFMGGVWSTLRKQDVIDFIQAKTSFSGIHTPNIPNASQVSLQDPMQILKVRFAKGEISQEEFQSMRTELTVSASPTIRKCSSCGSEVLCDDMFCPNCGLRVV